MAEGEEKQATTLAEKWAEYEQECIPAGAGPVQRQESKRAFYMGAYAWRTLVIRGLSDEEGLCEADANFLDSLEEEVKAFFKAVERGWA